MDILYQSDDVYAPYMGISITSLLINNPYYEAIKIYVLDGGISSQNKDKLRQTCDHYGVSMQFIDCLQFDERLDNSGLKKYRGSYATFYKLFLSSTVAITSDRVLYIDCDTVVVGDCRPLFEMDMEDYMLAMADDLLGYQYKRQIGFRKEEPYFNAGVVLFNLKQWRINNRENVINDFINHFPIEGLLKHEQDIINVLFRNQIKKLPQRYNAQSILALAKVRTVKLIYGNLFLDSKQTLIEEYEQAVICHFLVVGEEQPWVKNNIHPYSGIYHSYKEKSLWNDMEDIEANKNKRAMIKFERVLYRCLPRCLFVLAFKIAHDMKKEI